MGNTRYSDNDKAAALALLDSNGGNLKRTATELNMPLSTLQRWRDGQGTSADVTEMRNDKKESLAEVFEQIVRKYAARALDDKAVRLTRGKDAVIAAAAGLDKLRLLNGESTANLNVTWEALMVSKSDDPDSDPFT